jgi:maltose alpha-D-glucosyltransferase/alpha-amylase
MGDDLSLPERLGVRTPMQWSDEEHAGFSSANGKKLIRPVIAAGDFGYKERNVAAQQHDPESFLNWMERAIRVRKECPEFGAGDFEILKSKHDAVLALRLDWRNGSVFAVHNFSEQPVENAVKIKVADDERLVELLGPRDNMPIDGSPSLDLAPFGCRWFRLCGCDKRNM